MTPVGLLLYYNRTIRSVTEYACQAWHSGLTKGQSDKLELIQRRSLYVIYPELSYSVALNESGLTTLEQRRTGLCRDFFNNMQQDSHKLNYILPKKVHKSGTRSQRKYPLPKCRTERFKRSFIPYCLFNFQ